MNELKDNVVNENLKSADKIEQTIKSIVLNFKNYAEKYETLSVAIMTIGTAAMAFFGKAFVYSYKLGYFYYFGLNMSGISLSIDSNILLDVLCEIIIGIIIILINYMGYAAYRKKMFLRMYLDFAVVTFIYFIISLFGLNGGTYFKKYGLAVFVVAVIESVIITGMLFSINIGYILIKKMKEIFNCIKQNQWIKKITQIIFKDKTNMEEKKAEDDIKYDNKIKFTLIYVLMIVCYVFVCTALVGCFRAKLQTKISIIQQPSNVSFSELEEINSYAVMYEADDFLIISPCHEEHGELHVFKNYQIKIERNNQLLMKQTYKKIVMENTVSLTSESA